MNFNEAPQPQTIQAAEMTQVLHLTDPSQQAGAENPAGCCSVQARARQEAAGQLHAPVTHFSSAPQGTPSWHESQAPKPPSRPTSPVFKSVRTIWHRVHISHIRFNEKQKGGEEIRQDLLAQ